MSDDGPTFSDQELEKIFIERVGKENKLPKITMPKFTMEFIGFSSMGSTGYVEATIAMSPEYDIKSLSSDYIWKDGSRVIHLVFGLSDKKLSRKGYSLKEEWKQPPPVTAVDGDKK